MAEKLMLNIKRKKNDGYVNQLVECVMYLKPVFGYKFFWHDSIELYPGDDSITLSEYQTGGKICSGRNRVDCVKKMNDIIKTIGEQKFISVIEENKKKHGIANY